MTNNNAFYLIDDRYTKSGWDFDLRGLGVGFPKTRWITMELGNIGNGYPCVAKRDINPQCDGIVVLEAGYEIIEGGGFYIEFSDGKNQLFKLIQNSGFMWAKDKKLFKAEIGKHSIKITLDIDNRCCKIVSDGKDTALCDFTGCGGALSSLRFGYGENSIGKTIVDSYVKLYKNYIFNDGCITNFEGDLPCEYKVQTVGCADVVRVKYSDHKGDIYVYKISGGENSKVSISKSFESKKGKICFELRYLPSSLCGDKMSFGLVSKNTYAVTLCDKNSRLYAGDTQLKEHSKDVWQHLRIEADTKSGSCLVRLNGKALSNISFDMNVQSIDGIFVAFESINKSASLFSDIKVYEIQPLPCDYVPKPILPKKKGNTKVGMLMCSLWREGHHEGWDCITPFEEDHKPVLGWYDEGIAETADWEIKYMAEHGIDFALYCWFSNQNNMPIKSTMLSDAIHDGHMVAEYSDSLELALLWEAQNGLVPKDSNAFRKYFVPYWIDHFFSDPRYATVDNKAIMSIYGPSRLVFCFGSPEAVKIELDYLRSEVKKLGYDDLIIMGCARNLPIYKQCGFDAVHAYNWTEKGYDLEYTKGKITEDIKNNHVHTVPTISSGYNLVGWTGFRTPCMTPKDMKTALTWCRDEILPTFEKDTWKQKLVMLSTWNEYGEGTYISPSKLNGFGYLDAIRSVFTQDTPHKDVIPTQNQRSRIEILHVKDRKTLAPFDLSPIDKGNHGILKRYEFKTKEDLDKWEFFGISRMEIKDGRLFGHSDGDDPYMILKDDTFLPFSASRVQKIIANIRTYKPVNQMCAVHATYSKRQDKVFEKNHKGCLSVPDRVAPLEINFRRIREWPWEGKITAFRFDPVWAVGDFELESIDFLDSGVKYDLVVDSSPITMAQGVYEENGQFYIPFDTTSTLKNVKGVFYEWNAPKQQLTLKGTEVYVFTKGSDTVTCGDKQIKMSKPLSFSDGIPDIPAKLLAGIMGRKMIVKEDVLELR